MTDEELTRERDDVLRKKALRELGAQRNEPRAQPPGQTPAAQPENLQIPESIFIKPLHRDPAQHLQLLAVFLMFRARSSALPAHQQNLYGRVCGRFRLFEMFARDLVERSCAEHGVDFDRVQLVVDALWKAKLFSMSSTLMRDLRMYTDEDVGSDRFRKAVGLPARKRSPGGGEAESGKAVQLNAENLQQLLEQLDTPPASPPSRKQSESASSESGSRAAPVRGRTPPPHKSRYLIIISDTSLHGEKNNIYNPALLRQPNRAIIPRPSIQNPHSTPSDSGSSPESPAGGRSKQDPTNRPLAADTPEASQRASSDASTHTPPTEKITRAWSGFKGISAGGPKPDAAHNAPPFPPSGSSQTGTSESWAQCSPSRRERSAVSRLGNSLTGSDESGNANATRRLWLAVDLPSMTHWMSMFHRYPSKHAFHSFEGPGHHGSQPPLLRGLGRGLDLSPCQRARTDEVVRPVERPPLRLPCTICEPGVRETLAACAKPVRRLLRLKSWCPITRNWKCARCDAWPVVEGGVPNFDSCDEGRALEPWRDVGPT